MADYLKRAISDLSKRHADIKPVADSKKKENRELQRHALLELETKRRVGVSIASKRAMAGYVFNDKQGHQHNVVPIHEGNAEDVVKHYETARKRAMNEKAALQFHRFDGEGRVYQRIHSERDFTGAEGKTRKKGFDVIMQAIATHKAEKKAAMEQATRERRKELADHYRTVITELVLRRTLSRP